MQSTRSSIPGYRIFEYLLMLAPHEDLCKKIMPLKEEFAEKYQSDFARWSKPHITLVRFSQHAMVEERLINRIATVAMSNPSFLVELKDYCSFPSHSIYINVTSKLPIQALVKNIRTDAQRIMKMNEEKKPHFIMEPHLTIARKLQPWQYEKGWLAYRHKSFTGRFVCDNMLLLRRAVGELKYQIINRFEFQNMPVATKQGSLFS